MASKHIEIAVNDGMKAGFNAFRSNPGLLPVRELLDGLSNRKAFAAYCGAYGPQVEAIVGSKVLTRKAAAAPAKPRNSKRVASGMTDVTLDEIRQLSALCDKLGLNLITDADDLIVAPFAEEVKEAAKASKPAPAEKPVLMTTTFGAGTVAFHKMPTKAGSKFRYTNKSGVTSRWIVVAKLANGGIEANRLSGKA